MNWLFTLFLLCFLTSTYAQQITVQAAQADVEEFARLLRVESSYYQTSSRTEVDAMLRSVLDEYQEEDSIPVIRLTHILQGVMAQIKDSHASVRLLDYDRDQDPQYRMRFPFPLAPLDGHVVALRKTEERGRYEYFHAEYPFVKAINRQEVMAFLHHYSFDNNIFPDAAQLRNALHDLRRIGSLYSRQEETLADTIQIVLTNGIEDTTILAPIRSKNSTWRYPGNLRELPIRELMADDEPFSYKALIKKVDEEVAYIMIPKMIRYRDYPDFGPFFENYLRKLNRKRLKGLIVDIRGNSGGYRSLIHTLAKFVVTQEEAPWVANVAYVRSDQQLDEDMASMTAKQLYAYDSSRFDELQRAAIDSFMMQFDLQIPFDHGKFSEPFFMVWNFDETYQLKIPVYILCDENSFSAASVMASALKGLQNVTICGVTTNGSSGRSRYFFLPHSNIRVKLSTMLSLQRNGWPLDGYGTEPDIVIERDEAQIMGRQDTQLLELVKIIQQL